MDSAADDTDKRIRVFSVEDVAKDSADFVVGGLFALSKDLDTSGPRIWMTGGAGWYQYPTDSGKIRGVYSSGDLLAGYAFEGNNYEINLLAGGSAENDMLSAYDQSNPVQGTAVGPKVRGDIYVNPTPQSVLPAKPSIRPPFKLTGRPPSMAMMFSARASSSDRKWSLLAMRDLISGGLAVM